MHIKGKKKRKVGLYNFIDVAPMVREIMRRTGRSQNQTAELIGVSWMTVSFWLRGRNKARPPYAAMVERVLRELDRTSKTA